MDDFSSESVDDIFAEFKEPPNTRISSHWERYGCLLPEHTVTKQPPPQNYHGPGRPREPLVIPILKLDVGESFKIDDDPESPMRKQLMKDRRKIRRSRPELNRKYRTVIDEYGIHWFMRIL